MTLNTVNASILFRSRDLMRQEDLFSFFRGLHDRQAHFQRCHPPGSAVADRFVENHGIVEFFQLSAAGRTAPANEWNVFGSFVAVDIKPELRLADIATFACRD